MNITIKKPTLIITAVLAVTAIMSSCSKESTANDGKNGKKAPAAVVRTNDIIPAGQNTLNATRAGQYATLTWSIGSPNGKIKQIYVLRSPTGVKKQKRVADLEPTATSYKDCLPNANPQWFWIRVIGDNGQFQDIGPVRVNADRAGAAHYIKPDSEYKVTVTRTDDVATITWAFPENDYKMISATRYPRPVTEPFKGTKDGDPMLATKEGNSQCTDVLPDPNADYWYWFRVTLKSGAVIYKGPVKADYPKRSLPSVKSNK